MALGPKEMGEAILRNLQDKTGKSLEAWFTIVSESNLSEKKEIAAFLKARHNLGHFQAQKVAEQFTGRNTYNKPEELEKLLFNTTDSWQLYEALKSTIQRIGKEVRVQPCKTYVPFYRKTQFATLRQTKDQHLELSLNLPSDFDHDRFSRQTAKGSARLNFQTTITNRQDINQDLVEALTQAYQLN